MNKSINRKLDTVKEINALATSAVMTIAVDYSKIKSLEIKHIRRTLFEKHVKIKVFKNTLAKKAFKNTQNELLSTVFSGPILIIFSSKHISDLIRTIDQLKSKYNEIKIKSICIYGNLFFEKDIKELKNIPNMQEAIAKLITYIRLPILNVKNYIKNPYNKLYWLLKILSEKKKI